jgi:hypothetical protein
VRAAFFSPPRMRTRNWSETVWDVKMRETLPVLCELQLLPFLQRWQHRS